MYSPDQPTYRVYYDKDFGRIDDVVHAHNPSQVIVITDKNTSKDCAPILFNQVAFPFREIVIKPGEENKNLSQCHYVWKELKKYGCDRKSLIINLGGGIVGDLGGFCASTFMRGIEYIHIPTTLLGMVDSSIGGKLGVDLEGAKNYVGSFKYPLAVFVNSAFLKTLPAEHIINGYAEVVKHALIADQNLWNEIMDQDPLLVKDWSKIIKRSVEIKEKVVQEDPNEKGLRKILNFGHTIGHAIESSLLMDGRPILHGRAVAIGMVCESFISFKKGTLNTFELEQIANYLTGLFDKLDPDTIDRSAYNRFLSGDKKNINQRIMCTLLDGVGNCRYDQEVNISEIEESMEYYKQASD